MSFKDIAIKTEYRTGKSNVIRDFYMPVLSKAICYKRAVGFFSSTALIQIAKGVADLVANGGKICLIASPRLSEEDIIAIQIGYESRDKIISAALLRSFDEPTTYFECERLNLLATLIAERRLDIKIAFTEDGNQLGIYHEKMGLLYDSENNIIAFSGSTNETETAFISNYEVMDVFCSWQSEFEQRKVMEKELAFHMLWTNADSKVTIIDFPDIARNKLLSYKHDQIDREIDKKEFLMPENNICQKPQNVFRVPDDVTLFEYQNEAISKWIDSDAKGIFDMATGSGKTYTALGALSALSLKLKDNLGVFILCPYQHLVEQWVEDIKKFNVQPLICYSKYDWKKKFKTLLYDFKLGVVKNFCVIMVNASFATPYVQELIKTLNGTTCIVVDEAHNFGAEKLRKCMLPNFKYRLALSATLERHHDAEGTKCLLDYFKEKCIEFSLDDAIKRGFLTPYYYHPIVVNLEPDELDDYIQITEKVINILKKNPGDDIPKSAEMLLIKRARIIAGARNKLAALYEIIKKYKDDNNLLVYCGATKVLQDREDEFDEEDKRQIEAVVNMLGNDLNMRVSMFTSKEDSKERERIKNSFAEGKLLQALVAIKCLDEGVNIPGIRTAFILASSTNPKEYIQRRGRVLRKAPGKEYAVIYDFITLPRDLNSRQPIVNLDCEISLFKREKERLDDFVRLCENASESFKLIDKINGYYQLNYIGGKDYGI